MYTVLAGGSSEVWLAGATPPFRAARIATVDHREGWSMKARPSPDGRLLAFTLLPAPPGASAELWLLDLTAARTARRLANGVDLVSPPLWAPDGRRLVARRSMPDQPAQTAQASKDRYTLLLVDVTSGRSRQLLPETRVHGLYPLAWSQDGASLFYAVIDRGTDLFRLDVPSGSAEHLLQASTGIARDFEVLLGGAGFSYLERTSGGYSPRTVELTPDTRAGRLPSATATANQLSPDGRLLAGPPGAPLTLSDRYTGDSFALPTTGYAEFAGWLP